MSDSNDELLNYELGDEFGPEDEDELLLSDEESTIVTVASQQVNGEDDLLLDDEDLLNFGDTTKNNVNKKIETEIKTEEIVTTTTTRSQASTNDSIPKEEVTTSDKVPKKLNRTLKRAPVIGITPTIKVSDQSKAIPTNYDVTSTIKECDDQVKEDISSTNSSVDAETFAKPTEFSPKIKKIEKSPVKTLLSSEKTTNIPNLPTQNEKSSAEGDDDISLAASSQETTATVCTEESESGSHSLEHQNASSFEESFEYEQNQLTELETEDSDECSERLNPKTCVERESGVRSAAGPNSRQQQQTQFVGKIRGGPANRGYFSGPPRPLGHFAPHFNPFQQQPQLSNENFNPQFQQQFRSQLPHQMPPRMEFRGRMPHNFRPSPYPNDLSRPRLPPGHQMRGPLRPDFHAGPSNSNLVPPFRLFNGNPSLRPGQMPPQRFDIRPRMAPPPQQQQQYLPQQFVRQPQNPGNLLVRPASHSISNIGSALPGTTNPVVPRKVLINPNFKGGVEAATNQLMLDNPQYLTAHNDAELLRQQEAFINRNRMQIEKRRHERSPERERSYSPPQRRERRAYSRERDVRKPYNSFNNRGGANKMRRGNSREPYPTDKKSFPRRRSGSIDNEREKRDDKQNVAEDAETRAYRLEIEKQKTQREQLLRDKEMRRRKAAEEKTKEEEKKSTEERVEKLTPIIVTEKKIISLKKKGESQQQQQQQHQVTTQQQSSVPTTQKKADSVIQRIIPTAKIMPETQTPKSSREDMTNSKFTELPKQQPQNRVFAKSMIDDDSEYDEEDELLADSPTPPLTPPLIAASTSGGNRGMFANRRVILKSSHQKQQQHVPDLITTDLDSESVTKKMIFATDSATTVSSKRTNKPKGIFDRLDRKICVSEATKRKIQRIVINSQQQ